MSTVKSKKLQVGTDATSSNNFTIYQPATPDGTLRIGVGNADSPTEIAQFTSSGLVSGVSKLDTATGSAPSYSARAWVNFNGTGTVAIRQSGNVSSITDNSTGDYTINFTTSLTDANYSLNVTTSNASSGAAGSGPVSLFITNGTNTRVAPTTSAARFLTFSYNGGSLIDCEYILCSVFR